LMFGMLFALSLPLLADAASKQETQESKILINFLESMKNGDIDGVIKYVNDERFESTKRLKEEYKLLLFKDKLVEYEIIENKENNYFIVNLSFENGGVSKVPFTINSDKVNINSESLDTDDFEVIKEGEDLTIRPLHTLCDWHFSARNQGSTFYSDCEFNISGTSSLDVLLTQETSISGVTPGIVYSVVKKHWYGDDVWGSRYVSGTKSSPYSTTITGKSDSFTGAQMRFETDTNSKGARYEGIGSVLK
ncbi:hypothetical protein U5N28_09650, partial [Lysinibacillus telephonicus]